jgi:putative phosphoribosyl transferase
MEIKEINIPIGKVILKGNLNIPSDANAFVIFSHGSGSSRFSTRNNFVAEQLNKEKMATLLTDLLTEHEDLIFENRFNIELLTARLISVTSYVRKLPQLKDLPTGYFGASTGAASALQAAAEQHVIHAVVSRGGRPDLAQKLNKVKAPTLLIVGSLDTDVIVLNEKAYLQLTCEKKMEIVKGASHLFEETGTLHEVVKLATNWLKKHLLNFNIKAHAVQK